MPRILTFDTETTGLPARDVPVHIVQLAWILDDETGATRESACYLVRPDGWTIPERVVEIHGITTEIALEYGRPLDEVLDLFLGACARADLLVAHYIAFDWRILTDACALAGRQLPGLPRYCTKDNAVDLVSVAPDGSGRRGPKLVHAYRHFTGLVLDGAHDALEDSRACRAVYYGIQRARGC